MATFITRLEARGGGPRVAVKDIIDVAGVPTTAGCRAIASAADAAERDAACLAGCRAADARLVGKANLHELAVLPLGTNPWFGTPVNPLDPSLIPGGSSSGSAVAVATGEADVALASDTGGSVRIPSACCGTAGLKTTHGRIPLDGVWPLAPSLDTVGPMARDVPGLVLGMQLLEPGFEVAETVPTTVGRFRLQDTDPAIDAAVDETLARSELEVVDIDLPGWIAALASNSAVLLAEAWTSDRHLLDRRESVGADTVVRIELGQGFDTDAVAQAREGQKAWQPEL